MRVTTHASTSPRDIQSQSQRHLVYQAAAQAARRSTVRPATALTISLQHHSGPVIGP
ncbi:hypothetical protein [Candidatus Poriferisocius sp.]|uniref:hypothetical protein n=1 Tax=Candidatus Poriferisocius sp. TaxID=3101276 RepID=UPI003B02DF87